MQRWTELALEVRVPWWAGAYLTLLRAFAAAGMVKVDVDIAAAFIRAHSRCRILPGGQWIRLLE